MKFKAAEIETHKSEALVPCWEGNFFILFDSLKLYIGSTFYPKQYH